MEISALHNAILQSPAPPRVGKKSKRSVRFMDHDEENGDGSSSDDSSTSFIDDGINIFDPLPRPTAPMISPVVSASSTADLLPPAAAAVGRRDSLEMRYQLEDETKRQLSISNETLKQQMEELQQENERLQRQMAVQNKEHRYAQALWNDKVLDLQVELDAAKLEHYRVKEAQEDALLEREFDNLRSQLKAGDHSDNDDTDNDAKQEQQSLSNSTHEATATEEQSHHFATIPPRFPSNNATSKEDATTSNPEALVLQQQQQTIEELTSQQVKAMEQWETEKSELHSLIQKMTDQVEDGRIRVEWLEQELIAMCPSDTDDDEEKKIESDINIGKETNKNRDDTGDDSSGRSDASTKKKGRPIGSHPQIFRGSTDSGTKATGSLLREDTPKHLLIQRLREVLDSYVQIQGHQSRKIEKLTKQLKALEKEKEMDEGMQFQQMAEMKQKISYYQHRLQQTQKTLEFEQVSRDEFHNEWTRRIEQLEVENLRVSQQASKWEEQFSRQTGLLKRQLSSLQDKFDQSTIAIETLEKEKAEACASQKKASFFSWNTKVDSMTLDLKQRKERGTMLEQQLEDQSTKLKTTEKALGKARERIKVLMAYADMDESSGDLSPKAT